MNAKVDIFSSAVPTPGIMYVSTDNKILRLNNAAFSRGSVNAATTLFEGLPGTTNGQLYLDTANDRLFAVIDGAVRVFDNASSRISRQASTATNIPATGIVGDPKRGKIYVSRPLNENITEISAFQFNNSGSLVANNSFFSRGGEGNAMLLDSRLDELYLGALTDTNLPHVSVFPRVSTLSGEAHSVRGVGGPRTQLSKVFALELDASPQAPPFRTNLSSSNLLVFSGTPKIGQLNLFEGNGSRSSTSDVAPLRNIAGQATGLETSPVPNVDTTSQMVVDRFSGTLYVGTTVAIRIFNRAATAQGNEAPDRSLNTPAHGIALDRTR